MFKNIATNTLLEIQTSTKNFLIKHQFVIRNIVVVHPMNIAMKISAII